MVEEVYTQHKRAGESGVEGSEDGSALEGSYIGRCPENGKDILEKYMGGEWRRRWELRG